MTIQYKTSSIHDTPCVVRKSHICTRHRYIQPSTKPWRSQLRACPPTTPPVLRYGTDYKQCPTHSNIATPRGTLPRAKQWKPASTTHRLRIQTQRVRSNATQERGRISSPPKQRPTKRRVQPQLKNKVPHRNTRTLPAHQRAAHYNRAPARHNDPCPSR
jgi:hypothetical protein